MMLLLLLHRLDWFSSSTTLLTHSTFTETHRIFQLNKRHNNNNNNNYGVWND